MIFVGAGSSFAGSRSIANGRLVFLRFEDTNGESYALYVVKSDGSGARMVSDAGLHPAWSPDGRMIAYEIACCPDEGPGIAIVKSDGSGKGRVGASSSAHPAVDGAPRWSPDGQRIVFETNAAASGLGIQNIHGQRWTPLPLPKRLCGGGPDWSPDGKRIAFVDSCGRGGSIYVVGLDGTGLRKVASAPLAHDAPSWVFRYAEFDNVRWSPDGRRLLVSASGVFGQNPYDAIYFVSPTGGKSTLVLRTNVTSVSWSPDGKRFAYAGGKTCCAIHIFDPAHRRDRTLALTRCRRPARCQDVDWGRLTTKS